MAGQGIKIKICGLKRAADIEAVNLYQPEYTGFVFAPSKRQVTREQAQKLKQHLNPAIKAVGVFVNAATDEIATLVQRGIIDVVQLHGDEDEAYVQQLKKLMDRPIVKAVRVKAGCESELLTAVDYYLFDTYSSKAYGGTGASFDLSLLQGLKITKPFFIAGGLTAGNVAQAIKTIKSSPLSSLFYGVDTSGGVETGGFKDALKIKEFIKQAR